MAHASSLLVVGLTALLGAGCANTTTFHTNPVGAKVYVNGQLCGDSPCKYDTRYGFPDRIRVQLEKPGFRSAEFFLDTRPPVATYALLIVGSYFFHTFDEEYRFQLAPVEGLTPPAAAPSSASTASPPNPDPAPPKPPTDPGSAQQI